MSAALLGLLAWLVRSTGSLLEDLAGDLVRRDDRPEEEDELARADDVLDAWLGDGIGPSGL